MGRGTASAIALDPLTVQVLPAAEFREFVTSRPGAALELIRMLMSRLREATGGASSAYDATARVARLLCDLANTPSPTTTVWMSGSRNTRSPASSARHCRSLAPSPRSARWTSSPRDKDHRRLDLDALRRVFV